MKTLFLMPFAVWRVTSLLVQEEGPCGIFDKFRHAIGIRYDEHANKYGKNIFAEAFSCFWCASIWVSFLGTILYAFVPEIVFWIELPFAVSGIAILADGLIYGES